MGACSSDTKAVANKTNEPYGKTVKKPVATQASTNPPPAAQLQGQALEDTLLKAAGSLAAPSQDNAAPNTGPSPLPPIPGGVDPPPAYDPTPVSVPAPTQPFTPPVPAPGAAMLGVPAPTSGGGKPKKYAMINGRMQLNPGFTAWQKQQAGQAQISVPPPYNATHPDALTFACSMDDAIELDEVSTAAGGAHVQLSTKTNEAIEHLQGPELCAAVGLGPDVIIDSVSQLFARHEIPIGLLNKMHCLTEYDLLEFIIDDSGSMQCKSDTVDKVTGRSQTRWEEARDTVKDMMEVLAYVPTPAITIVFLCRTTVLRYARQGESPEQFLAKVIGEVENEWKTLPTGSTPTLERLELSFRQYKGKRVVRYVFGDGQPNGGEAAVRKISALIKNRANPQGNPLTFMSCTNEDSQVEWMKEVEEVATFCAECDDFNDESREILRDQGEALPYTRGFHLICRLVSAMNPRDLDAMDESIPFAKSTLDDLLGVKGTEEDYTRYFSEFCKAQSMRVAKTSLDRFKAQYQWGSIYPQLLQVNHAQDIPAVQEFRRELAKRS